VQSTFIMCMLFLLLACCYWMGSVFENEIHKERRGLLVSTLSTGDLLRYNMDYGDGWS